MILRLLCIWLVFYSLLSSLMHGTMNLKFRHDEVNNPFLNFANAPKTVTAIYLSVLGLQNFSTEKL
jgi:hypothetical protein